MTDTTKRFLERNIQDIEDNKWKDFLEKAYNERIYKSELQLLLILLEETIPEALDNIRSAQQELFAEHIISKIKPDDYFIQLGVFLFRFPNTFGLTDDECMEILVKAGYRIGHIGSVPFIDFKGDSKWF